ncbi:DoxX family protein [Cohnella cholangitidis]|uniref:DoxX family protein n=1 Tax=Cohnella cholangitidis TaxID=2598458 RepID=A0A7G5BZF8_9BACL|nr:DoxX family protein [Cohnella cholangitidis]QMV42342.1 DoxX family protein [Cohnella cholangitidis]
MNIALWIVQGILGLGFIFSGWMKAVQYEKAKASWLWVKDVSRGFVFFIGIVELVGVLGVILPQATNISPVLTPIAATGLAAIVLLGAVFHIKRKEYKQIGVNIVFLALAVFVAVGRM